MRPRGVEHFTYGAACVWSVKMLADIRNEKKGPAPKAFPELWLWAQPRNWRAKRWTNGRNMTGDFAIRLKRVSLRRFRISSSMATALDGCHTCRIFRSVSLKAKVC